MTRKKAGLIITLNLILILLALLWYCRPSPLAFTCQGNFTFTDPRPPHNFSFEGGMTLHFNADGTGHFSLNGDAISTPHHWQVSRHETFKWRNMHGSLYEITILQIERFGHDQLPDNIFEKYIVGLTLGQKRLVTIEGTPDDATVIGNFYSPLLVCAE